MCVGWEKSLCKSLQDNRAEVFLVFYALYCGIIRQLLWVTLNYVYFLSDIIKLFLFFLAEWNHPLFLICGPKRPIHFLKINVQKFVLLRYNGHQATSIATLGAFPVFPSLSERPEKFRLLVAHLINLKIYECDFVITFFFLIQMNFGLIVNLDLKRALFSQEVRKV